MLAHSEARARREREHREDRERLLSMLAHELRTPLASVRMLLSSGVPGPQDLDRVDRCIADMSSVIERCIETGRLDERQPSVAVATCEVDSALHALRDAQRRPERVRLECDPLPPVRTDPQLLRIVLGNLLDNALKYAPPQATVRIAASPAPRAGMDGIEIAIENPPGDAGWPDPRQVFGKYYRAPKARRQTGSGLGLYLVSGLAGRLGGDVRYAPDDTVVRFVLWLPV
jgi:signal transduction histidine kinase